MPVLAKKRRNDGAGIGGNPLIKMMINWAEKCAHTAQATEDADAMMQYGVEGAKRSFVESEG